MSEGRTVGVLPSKRLGASQAVEANERGVRDELHRLAIDEQCFRASRFPPSRPHLPLLPVAAGGHVGQVGAGGLQQRSRLEHSQTHSRETIPTGAPKL